MLYMLNIVYRERLTPEGIKLFHNGDSSSRSEGRLYAGSLGSKHYTHVFAVSVCGLEPRLVRRQLDMPNQS